MKIPKADKGKYKVSYTVNGVSIKTKEYVKWYAMVCRCYSESYKKKNPTYETCSSSECFKSFQCFAEWCQDQIGFTDDFHLDKDLLSYGNTFYNEANCCFIPREINNFLCKRLSDRGNLPIGCSMNSYLVKGEVYSYIRSRMAYGNGKSLNLGNFLTAEQAFCAYKVAKENYAKELAEKWKDKIDPRAYKALMEYEVLITD